MTRFSFEVPLAHLQDFEPWQDFLFTLSMLYKQEEYRAYVHSVTSKGLLTTWVDNSYNELEQADRPDQLGALFYQNYSQRVVSPDSPEWSVEEIYEKYQHMCSIVPREYIIVVAKDFRGYEYLEAKGIRNFAVSYWCRPGSPKPEWVGWTWEELRQVLNLHFLGLNSVEEIKAVKPASCDTSMPIKLAMQGIDIHNWISSNCPHINTKDLGVAGKDFWEATLSPQQLIWARYNIKTLKELCNG